MTTGWGEAEVLMDVSSRRLAPVQHRHLPARGLLSLFSLVRAFLLTVIKRNPVCENCGAAASLPHGDKQLPAVTTRARSPLPTRQKILSSSPLVILLFTIRRVGRVCPHPRQPPNYPNSASPCPNTTPQWPDRVAEVHCNEQLPHLPCGERELLHRVQNPALRPPADVAGQAGDEIK